MGWGGWLETDNRAISVQLDLTGTLTGTELGKRDNLDLYCCLKEAEYNVWISIKYLV